MAKTTITAADLFCGAGGTSTGLRQACEEAGLNLKLIAVNHWNVAISTHQANHPEADSLCTNLDTVDPRHLVPSGKLDMLLASPECTHHSRARGGKPIHDQSRASAWRIVEWASKIRVETILMENVPEFQTWGPLNAKGRPIQSRKGELYFAFVKALQALGYRVAWRILNAADYGDPTSRQRLFLQARLGRKPIVWPERTHGPVSARPVSARPANDKGWLFDTVPVRLPYRTAREVIDWEIQGESIFRRKKPLKENTMRRIFRGLEKFAGLPFIVPQLSGGANRGPDQPIPTITTTSRGIGFCEPFIVELRNNQNARSLDEPLSTVATSGAHHGLCEPFLICYNGNHSGRQDGDVRIHGLEYPIPAIDTSNRYGLVAPSHTLDAPMPTITSVDAWALIESYLVKYNGTGGAMPVSEPLDTVTAKDRFGLVEPLLQREGGYALFDIRFRMLQPHELAAAMSFPKTYRFSGNRAEKVKQIGNAVPVGIAKALISAMLKA